MCQQHQFLIYKKNSNKLKITHLKTDTSAITQIYLQDQEWIKCSLPVIQDLPLKKSVAMFI